MNELAQVFEEAQKFLWDGKDYRSESKTYICHSIRVVPLKESLLKKAASIINNRLDGAFTVEEYLHLEIGIPEYKLTREKVQAYRKAWLQSLVEEFKDKK